MEHMLQCLYDVDAPGNSDTIYELYTSY